MKVHHDVLLAALSLTLGACATTPATSPTSGAAPAVSAPTPGFFLGLRTAVYTVPDLARAKAWYRNVLGVTPYFDQSFYVGFNVEGFELGLVPDSSATARRAAAGIAYWGVTNARDAYARLISLGATEHDAVQDVGGGVLVGTVHDPFGNLLGIIENRAFRATATGQGTR